MAKPIWHDAAPAWLTPLARTIFLKGQVDAKTAALAARIAERVVREKRDQCIRIALTNGAEPARLSTIWELAPATIERIGRAKPRRRYAGR